MGFSIRGSWSVEESIADPLRQRTAESIPRNFLQKIFWDSLSEDGGVGGSKICSTPLTHHLPPRL